MNTRVPGGRLTVVITAVVLLCGVLLVAVVAASASRDIAPESRAPSRSVALPSDVDGAVDEGTSGDPSVVPATPVTDVAVESIGGSIAGAGAVVAPAVEQQIRREGAAPAIVELSIPAGLNGVDRERRVAEETARVLEGLPPGSYRDVTALGIAAAVALTVDAEGLAALRRDEGIVGVAQDKVNLPALESGANEVDVGVTERDLASIDSTASIGAPVAWTAGFEGNGQVVAVFDTGVQAAHPFLNGPGGSKVVAEACFSNTCPEGASTPMAMVSQPGSARPCDVGCDHGTHVAGIVAGGRSTALPAGVAPGASLVAVQVFSVVGGRPAAYDSDIIAGLQWLKARRDAGGLPGLLAVNMSLGGGSYLPGPQCDADNLSMKLAIDALRGSGVLTVAAAGNNLPAGRTASPGCISSAITVGAANDVDLTVPSFSALSADVDLLAPGVSIRSSFPGSTSDPARMGWMSGTSMATPAVSGALAVLAEARPALTPDGRLNLLRETGRPLTARGLTVPYVSIGAALDPTAWRPTLPPGNPFGNWENFTVGPGAVSVSGWMLDPDALESVGLSVAVNGQPAAAVADRTRPDVGAAYPGYGAARGFSVTAPASGAVTVCITANDLGPGASSSLGCRSVVVATGSPFGNFEGAVAAGPGSVRVVGWAIDPDVASPVGLSVTVNGVATAVTADRSRPDVGAAYPGYGDGHGFEATLPTSARGSVTVCASMVNLGPGADGSLGCRSVVVATGSPFGNVELTQGGSGTVELAGWMIDPDTAAPVTLAVSIDGVVSQVVADRFRPDVGAAYPGYGDGHGFSSALVAAVGSRRVCVVAQNQGAGASTSYPCRVVTVL